MCFAIIKKKKNQNQIVLLIPPRGSQEGRKVPGGLVATASCAVGCDLSGALKGREDLGRMQNLQESQVSYT